MRVEWIVSLVLAVFATYAWWELRKVRGKSKAHVTFDEFEVDSKPMSQQELMVWVAPIAKTVYLKQSKDCHIAEAVIGATVASMVARSRPEHVARFLRTSADSIEQMMAPGSAVGEQLERLYAKQRRGERDAG